MIFVILGTQKIPFPRLLEAVARLKKYGEMVDDHQTELVKKLSEKGCVLDGSQCSTLCMKLTGQCLTGLPMILWGKRYNVRNKSSELRTAVLMSIFHQ